MQEDGDGDEERLWVLKTTAHRGQGVSVMPQQQAIKAALTSSTGEDASAELVQQYKAEQYVVARRKFYLRCFGPSSLENSQSVPGFVTHMKAAGFLNLMCSYFLACLDSWWMIMLCCTALCACTVLSIVAQTFRPARTRPGSWT